MAPERAEIREGEPEDGDGESEESRHERLNREHDQLLQELRVALPGVQVLFAFLLTVAFSPRFDTIDNDASNMYLVSVSLAAVASVLLIAPSVQHRIRFRGGTKAQLLRVANVLAISGAAALGLAIGTTVYVVGDVAFPSTPARWIGAGVTAFAALLWFVVPLLFEGGQADKPEKPM